jgi:hypothetical protein
LPHRPDICAGLSSGLLAGKEDFAMPVFAMDCRLGFEKCRCFVLFLKVQHLLDPDMSIRILG